MTATVRGISSGGRRGVVEQLGEKEYVVVYKVVTDDKRDGPIIARQAFGIPSIGDLYVAGNESDFGGAVVVRKEAIQSDDSPFEWEVIVTYSSDIGSRQPTQWLTPLDEPPEISFGFQERRIMIPGIYNDAGTPDPNGDWQNGIYAPNGELFDPQPEASIADPVWTITKNVQSISYDAFMKLANCVNSDSFQGVSQRQLMMKPPTAQRLWHQLIGYYWKVSYQIVYRFETWDIQVLNQGTYYYASGTPTNWWGSTQLRQTKKDDSGNPIIVNLTTGGDINTTRTPTFTRIRYYREINFSALGII